MLVSATATGQTIGCIPHTVQIDQLVIDEGVAAIAAETPHPRAPLPDLPPVPGTGTTFHYVL